MTGTEERQRADARGRGGGTVRSVRKRRAKTNSRPQSPRRKNDGSELEPEKAGKKNKTHTLKRPSERQRKLALKNQRIIKTRE